jgi:hypothetical protein
LKKRIICLILEFGITTQGFCPQSDYGNPTGKYNEPINEAICKEAAESFGYDMVIESDLLNARCFLNEQYKIVYNPESVQNHIPTEKITSNYIVCHRDGKFVFSNVMLNDYWDK